MEKTVTALKGFKACMLFKRKHLGGGHDSPREGDGVRRPGGQGEGSKWGAQRLQANCSGDGCEGIK